jgi:hypothetical protein
VPHLFEFTQEHKDAARTLLAEAERLRTSLVVGIEEAWMRPTEPEKDVPDAAVGIKATRIEPVDKVARPMEPRPSEWRDEVITAVCLS